MKTNTKLIAAITFVAVLAPSLASAEKTRWEKTRDRAEAHIGNKRVQRRYTYGAVIAIDAAAVALSFRELTSKGVNVATFWNLLTTDPVKAFQTYPITSWTTVMLAATVAGTAVENIYDNVAVHRVHYKKEKSIEKAVAKSEKADKKAEGKTEGKEFNKAKKATDALEKVRTALTKYEAGKKHDKVVHYKAVVEAEDKVKAARKLKLDQYKGDNKKAQRASRTEAVKKAKAELKRTVKARKDRYADLKADAAITAGEKAVGDAEKAKNKKEATAEEKADAQKVLDRAPATDEERTAAQVVVDGDDDEAKPAAQEVLDKTEATEEEKEEAQAIVDRKDATPEEIEAADKTIAEWTVAPKDVEGAVSRLEALEADKVKTAAALKKALAPAPKAK
jgi:hypothetical protein